MMYLHIRIPYPMYISILDTVTAVYQHASLSRMTQDPFCYLDLEVCTHTIPPYTWPLHTVSYVGLDHVDYLRYLLTYTYSYANQYQSLMEHVTIMHVHRHPQRTSWRTTYIILTSTNLSHNYSIQSFLSSIIILSLLCIRCLTSLGHFEFKTYTILP